MTEVWQRVTGTDCAAVSCNGSSRSCGPPRRRTTVVKLSALKFNETKAGKKRGPKRMLGKIPKIKCDEYRCVTQTWPPVTDLFCQFLNVCRIFSGETAKDF